MAKLLWALVLCAAAVYVTADEPPCQLGHITDVETWPSITQVEFRLGLLWFQQCVGSVLTSYHVLSAATCFSGDLYFPENRRIRAGASIRGQDGVIVGVRYAHIHPDFGLLGNDADIAIVEVEPTLELGPTIAQGGIIGQGIPLPVGLRTQLVAWGTTAQGGDTSDALLTELDLYVHSGASCLNSYITIAGNGLLTENMICLGLDYTRGRDFDARDLGAPVYYEKTLVGIMSFGDITDDVLPAVATAVSSYSDWIIYTASILT